MFLPLQCTCFLFPRNSFSLEIRFRVWGLCAFASSTHLLIIAWQEPCRTARRNLVRDFHLAFSAGFNRWHRPCNPCGLQICGYVMQCLVVSVFLKDQTLYIYISIEIICINCYNRGSFQTTLSGNKPKVFVQLYRFQMLPSRSRFAPFPLAASWPSAR